MTLLPSVLLTYLATCTSAFSIPPYNNFAPATRYSFSQKPLQDPFEAWLQKQEHISLDRLLTKLSQHNYNGGGKDMDGTAVATSSNSQGNAGDRWYEEVRDAAFTIKTLVDMYADDPTSRLSTTISKIVDAYAASQRDLQQSITDLKTANTPSSTPPSPQQLDGPALRAITLISYIRAYNSSHASQWNTPKGSSFYNPFYDSKPSSQSIIKTDLDFVSKTWNDTSYDLWNEVEGMHFSTATLQLRALVEGAQIAHAFGDESAARRYAEQASYLTKFVRRFWNKKKRHLVATLWSHRSGLDCSVLVAAVHGVPSKEAGVEPVFAPWSEEVLGSLVEFVGESRKKTSRFLSTMTSSSEETENITPSSLHALPLPHYPEQQQQSNDNQPSTFCTSTTSHLLHSLATHLSQTRNLTITPLSLPFYRALTRTASLPVEPGVMYPAGGQMVRGIVERVREVGDEFLGIGSASDSVNAGGDEGEEEQVRRGDDDEEGDAAFLAAVRGRRVALVAVDREGGKRSRNW